MNFNTKQQVNISAYQIALVLLICRCQSFMVSIKLRETLNVNNSNIFISMVISLLAVFVIYVPAIKLLKKFNYINIIDISKTVFPFAGNVISIIFALYFILMAIAHIANTNFFMLSYVYIDASPFLILGIILVSIYAISVGIESVFRVGAVIFALFFILNAIVFILLTPAYNFHHLGPFVLSDVTSIIQNSSTLTFSAELVAILIFTEYCKEKTLVTFSWVQIVLFCMEVLLMLCITLVMGRYTNTNTFPLYTISSMIEVPILERLESFYIVLDTMLSFVKTSIYIFLSKRCLQHVIGNKFNISIISVLGVTCLISAVVMTSNIKILKQLVTFLNSPIVISFLIIVIPILLLISSKIKKISHSTAQ